MNICPCLDGIIKYFSSQDKSAKVQQQQESLNQPEQMNEQLPLPTSTVYKNTNEQIQLTNTYFQEEQGQIQKEDDQDLLDVKMNLNKEEELLGEKEQQRDIEDLLKEELAMTPQEAVALQVQKNQSPPPETFEMTFEDLTQNNFSINLDPLDPFYPLIHEKTHNIESLFTKKGQNLEVGQPNRTTLEITRIDNGRMTTFISKYVLKCSFSYYLSLLKNQKQLISFSSNIAELKVLEAYKPNLTRNTIKFKRMSSFEPRECSYIKYQNSVKRQHWQIYIHDQKAEPSPNYKSCQLFCVKNIKQIDSRQLHICEYVEVDLQTPNAGNIIPKLSVEYRNFLNNLQNHLESNYEMETA